MNSTNWPTPSVWVFIFKAQMVEQCSASGEEAMGSNTFEVLKIFLRIYLQLLKLQ